MWVVHPEQPPVGRLEQDSSPQAHRSQVDIANNWALIHRRTNIYKIHIYDIKKREEMPTIELKSAHDLFNLKHINWQFPANAPTPILVTIEKVDEFSHGDMCICRAYICYNPFKNLWRSIFNRFEQMAASQFINQLFD